ncbi:MAG TPA: crossover junction endodeoxyribonuclease RuvC [Gammaproteobacteria bacterium]|nr:crossover junction endodeoxyribonuclease RuvC [Gammaproteobacteria bacterium]
MTRILGIDPGSQITGFGVIEARGGGVAYVDSGCIRLRGPDLGARLRLLHEQLREVIAASRPEEVAVERVFVARNPDSALKLGQARGVAICSAALQGLPVSEYAARQVKQALVGRGGAQKRQVQHMIVALLQLAGTPQADAADALAIAVCHAHHRRIGGVLARAVTTPGGAA